MPRLLLIDDDEQLGPLLKQYFARFGLDLDSATHPREGLAKLVTGAAYELVILDLMLPDMDGFEVCREIRKHSEIPIIMLTARGDVMDRIIGLEIGADDYLPKPFEPRELVARVQNILKRIGPAAQQHGKAGTLDFGVLSVDPLARAATVDNKDTGLTHNEFLLLSLLISQPGQIFSRDEILNHLKGNEVDIFSRAVDISISRLRQKLKPLDCIKTHRGYGYSFIPPLP
ncbi:MAG: response regulator transcription factor [Gammaproteobacteria bacterium]|nr:response regulator transcription factor [Gammaproteobacteria bacterium]